MYQQLKRAPDLFNYLDAAQLVRHYLGLKTQAAPGGVHAGKRAVLVYLFWEPANAPDLQACANMQTRCASSRTRWPTPISRLPPQPTASSGARGHGSRAPPGLRLMWGSLETRYGVQIAAAR